MNNTKSSYSCVGRHIVVSGDVSLAYIAENLLDGVIKVEHDTRSGQTKLRYADRTEAISTLWWLQEMESWEE